MSDTGPFGPNEGPGGNSMNMPGYYNRVRTVRPRTSDGSFERNEERRFRTLSAMNSRSINPNVQPLPRDANNVEMLDGQRPGLGPNASTGQIMDYIADEYPGMIGMFNINPEVRNVLIEAARWGWTPGKLNAALESTAWHRSNGDRAKQFQILEQTNPAEAQAQVAAVAANVQNAARTMGIGLSGQQIGSMAWQATRNGWNDAQTIDGLLRGLDWNRVQGGTLTDTVDDIKSTAADYLVGVTDSTAQQYAARIASGELTLEGVRSIMQRQAKARFSWMSSEIDQGIAPVDYFMPIRDVIASTLEVAPESIDMMDPRWMGMLEVSDGNGNMRAATRNEAMLKSRQQGEFASTAASGEMVAGMTQIIKEGFGF